MMLDCLGVAIKLNLAPYQALTLSHCGLAPGGAKLKAKLLSLHLPSALTCSYQAGWPQL